LGYYPLELQPNEKQNQNSPLPGKRVRCSFYPEAPESSLSQLDLPEPGKATPLAAESEDGGVRLRKRLMIGLFVVSAVGNMILAAILALDRRFLEASIPAGLASCQFWIVSKVGA